MTREEQIEVATAAYINGRLKNNVPPEEIEEIRLAYQAGFICADEHPDLYSVTRKAVERERKHLIDKACEWLKEHLLLDDPKWYVEGEKTLQEKMIDDLRKAMEQ